jgi:anti-sigma B factor antagonist
MDIKVEQYGRAAVLRCKGEITEEAVDLLSRDVEARLADKINDVVIDLTEVPFMDSRALEVLLDLRDKLAAQSGQLTLAGVRDSLAKIFEITRLDAAFDTVSDCLEAVKGA